MCSFFSLSLCRITTFEYYHIPNPKMISGLTNHQGFPFDVYFYIYGVRYVLDLMLFHFFANLFIGSCFFIYHVLPRHTSA
jgi:hypothetical protein